MKDFIKLVSGLSVYNDGRYDGCRIGRVCLERTGEICTVESVVKKEKGIWLVLEAVGYDRKKEVGGSLTVTMLKRADGQTESASFSNHKGWDEEMPAGGSGLSDGFSFIWKQDEEIPVDGEGLLDEFSLIRKQAWEVPVDGSSRSGEFSFTQEQVDDYLEWVHDTNPIHRGENAIVPGLMLVDFLLDRNLLFPQDQKQEIRFRKPLPVGSRFSRVHINQEIRITSPDCKLCYVTAAKCRKGEKNV